MGRELHIKRGTGKAIAKMLGVSEQTVCKAIRGRTDSELARKIRALAISCFGAIEIETKKELINS